MASRAGGLLVRMSWLVALFTAAQLADLVTGFVARPRGWTGTEHNPLAAALLASPLLALAAKLALLALVVSTVVIVNRSHPRAALTVLIVGVAAGMVGAYSNSTEFGGLLW